MTRFITGLLIGALLSMPALAQELPNKLSDAEIFNIATQIDLGGDGKTADTIYYNLLTSSDGDARNNSAFVLAQKAVAEERFSDAVLYFRWMLQNNPDLPRVHFDLALCYMKLGYWSRADYHLRMAMAAPDLPPDMVALMQTYRHLVRQNKNWGVTFNFGAAPDSNVNNAVGGTECINTPYGILCHDLNDPESAVGYNFTLGGHYEFRLSDDWRLKSEGYIYTNIYNLHEYDDFYLSFATGPRYIWSRGDIWLAATANRRWYGWDEYSWALGAKLDVNYDFTRRMSGALHLGFSNNAYDEFDEFLSGDTYTAFARIVYNLTPRTYITLRSGVTREDTTDTAYSYWQPSVAFGIGFDLPYDFHIYLEPSVYWSWYDSARLVADNGALTQITEHNFTGRYSASVSNNKFNIHGFVPAFVFSYARRDSNIWQREFDKFTIEFTIRQRF